MKKLIVLTMLGFLTACMDNHNSDYVSSSSYSTHQTIKVKVISRRAVTVSRDDGVVGVGAGAAIGGLAGSSITDSEAEKTILTIGGAILGGMVGDSIEKEGSKIKANEYVLEKSDGSLITIVIKDGSFRKGDKAYLIMGKKPVLRLID